MSQLTSLFLFGSSIKLVQRMDFHLFYYTKYDVIFLSSVIGRLKI